MMSRRDLLIRSAGIGLGTGMFSMGGPYQPLAASGCRPPSLRGFADPGRGRAHRR